MALILSIETATPICSVALHNDGSLIDFSEVMLENTHGEMIMGMVDKIIEASKYKKSDLKGIAVSAGPGSYTGLRIGVSVAKGLCFGLGIPLVGISTIKALAFQALQYVEDNGVIIPLMDARRMEVYTASFDSEMNLIDSLRPLVVEQNVFLDKLEKGKVVFVGDGVEKLRHLLDHPNAKFPGILNSARGVGALAFRAYKKSQFEDLAYFEPNYLKEFKVIKSKKNLLLQ
ncbi:TsaB protein, required for threonylcarbamoyladenosine (t(6)A) formation in tRNA [Indibacter alkaliphilus LW1]|jgi:tRNA threonylcarbamoyladenosine biosynthesis protein TsaB|uniref:TsaB protein, required for threonylcarbamoyladenosine (T(6)A) formation in tRNA n=1 Tax=Indibacter alkaliphilus (strain CCUG 57479 / KCTC 22604 / LW1) TaxID=1189612 RepID=S2D0M8_INDAL|nr:tRNA (adenosine(37)-N6)-threonylcarbamoyltransferase complex dimerization subunit type 1 TsaB [Indibacter alkaliphilus]EOZ92444.1 TsaB protein, required for threonylcarbamoyladenosine (t(6)A) formation in tRNA [Indibacter alkaliphilus LW1]